MITFKEVIRTILIQIYILLFYFSCFTAYYYTLKGLLFGGLLVRTVIIIYLIYELVNYHVYHSTFDGNGPVLLRSDRGLGIMRDYFPGRMRKTAEIPPNRNYLLAYFPHGILTVGICSNMLLGITHFMRLFPGIRPKAATLSVNFWPPFFREIWRCLGYVSSSKPSLLYYLNKSNDPAHPDNADGFTSYMIALAVGGEQEALLTEPGKYTIVLKKRLGFVKLAIQTGSPIVPSFGFGENDLYTPLNKAWFRGVQKFFKTYFDFTPLLMKGRGGNYFLPYKKRVTVVIGSPIDVKRTTNPDSTYIEEIHAKVVEAVRQLFDTYKSEYIENSEEAELIII
uniref:Acyltransferase n=1 Tax=Bactrocera latifrons TaxID=174628 RepID=A0A0K8VJ18_BACLA